MRIVSVIGQIAKEPPMPQGMPIGMRAKRGSRGLRRLSGFGVSPKTSILLFCRRRRQDKGSAEGFPLLNAHAYGHPLWVPWRLDRRGLFHRYYPLWVPWRLFLLDSCSPRSHAVRCEHNHKLLFQSHGPVLHITHTQEF